MPLERPTLQQLRDRIYADFEVHTNGNPHLRGSLEFALANAMVGISHTAHGVIDFYAKQLFDNSAEDEFMLRRAAPFGLTLIAPVTAQGSVIATGTDATLIPAGTELQALDGQLYTTDNSATIVAGTATFEVTAIIPGAEGNQLPNSILTFTSTPAGIDSETIVDPGGLKGGADIETIERFKTRFAERKQTPPQGGSQNDYIAWAKQARVEVTRVWVHPHENPLHATEHGSILIYVVTDNLLSPIPTAALLTSVSDYINQPDIRPIGAKNVYVQAPTAKPLNITFNSLTPLTAPVQQAIETELADLLKREAEPGGTILLSHIREAISIASGELDHNINLVADVTTVAGEIIVPGVMTWPGI